MSGRISLLAAIVGLSTLGFASSDALGHCGKCEGDKKAATQPAGKYVCPMKCEASDKPGKCSKCGMDLVEKKADAKKHDEHKDHQH